MFGFAPDNYNPQQIQELQDLWDQLLAGDVSSRRKVRWLPGQAKMQEVHDATKIHVLEFDEFLLKVICAGLDVQPQELGFAHDINRAQGDTQERISMRRSMRPLQSWLSQIFDEVIALDFGLPDLRFKFLGMEWADREQQAIIGTKYIAFGARTIDDIRVKDLGEEPLPDGLGAEPIIITGRNVFRLRDVVEGKTLPPVDTMAATVPKTQPVVPKTVLPDEGKLAAITGAMVALFPPADVAARLACPDGEPAEQLHITLAFLGDADGIVDAGELEDALARLAETTPPLEGTIAGTGRFVAGPDGLAPFWAAVDLPGVNELREAVLAALREQDVAFSETHGFTPHMTLAYIGEGDPDPAEIAVPIPVRFDELTLAIADRRVSFALSAGDVGKALGEYRRFVLNRIRAGRSLRPFEAPALPVGMAASIHAELSELVTRGELTADATKTVFAHAAQLVAV
jgi:2'-5' RNA ligase